MPQPLLRYCLLSVSLLLGACSPVEDTRPGQPVKQRQEAFKSMLRSFEPMGKMLRDGRYDSDAFVALADSFAALQEKPWPHFGPDTLYPPSRAKGEVWTQPEAFSQARQTFTEASDALLAAARSRDRRRVETTYQAVQDACQSCHRRFREK